MKTALFLLLIAIGVIANTPDGIGSGLTVHIYSEGVSSSDDSDGHPMFTPGHPLSSGSGMM
jgi:hypothetical protein